MCKYDEDFSCEQALSRASKISGSVFLDDVNISDIATPRFTPASINKKKYFDYLNEYFTSIDLERKSNWVRNTKLSFSRCSAPCIQGYNWRYVKACQLKESRFIDKITSSFYDMKYGYEVSPSWYNFVMSLENRVESLHDIIIKYVFVLPKCTSAAPELVSSKVNHRNMIDAISQVVRGSGEQRKVVHNLKQYFAKFYDSSIRQRIFFPDRKLVQFDSGKLQTLAALLIKLKKGNHKCLIFTQMSKMLDIFEIFLNLHDFSYLRLDGSTSVERRQRLMDKFNTDPKIFCFILSTRSGGLGINLTGADSVIFYDSDWNPAMDAQAQDRAHRIGQTKEVHIYRFICKSTVEENILLKAQQKRHLDFLVIGEGKFSEGSIFSSQNLQDMLGNTNAISDEFTSAGVSNSTSSSSAVSNGVSTSEGDFDVEAAMAAVEDVDDLSALKSAIKEADAVEDDFNDNVVYKEKEEGAEDADPNETTTSSAVAAVDKTSKTMESTQDESEVDKDFNSWQFSLGTDFSALYSALKPVERYAFKFHTQLEPYYSMYYISEQQKLAEIVQEEMDKNGNVITVEEIEKMKEEEEYRVLSEGELLATDLTKRDVRVLKLWYNKERDKRYKLKRYRKMTGDSWSHVVDELTGVPFWYNEDTGEACYAQPQVITDKETYISALERKFNAIPENLMIRILEFLIPFPDRISCSTVCARWYKSFSNIVFHKRVLSVENGAKEGGDTDNTQRLGKNVFGSVVSALEQALPGDTIAIGAGHHWEKHLVIKCPLKFVGVDTEPSKCVIEVSDGIEFVSSAKSVLMVGVSVRRTRRHPKDVALLKVNHCSLKVGNLLTIAFM